MAFIDILRQEALVKKPGELTFVSGNDNDSVSDYGNMKAKDSLLKKI